MKSLTVNEGIAPTVLVAREVTAQSWRSTSTLSVLAASSGGRCVQSAAPPAGQLLKNRLK